MPKHLSKAVFALCAASFFAVASTEAVTYTEIGDAGQLRPTAQATAANQAAANQPLSQIFGSLLTGTDIDLYIINITNPAAFSATTVNTLTNGTGLDTALFLFDSNGRPVYANDDDASGTVLTSTLSAGNPLGPQVAGFYYLAISLSGAEPVNFANFALFAMATSTSTRGPNPISANDPLANWDTSNVNASFPTFPSNYQIDLTGATTAAVPEPTTFAFAVLGVMGLVGLTHKRKRS